MAQGGASPQELDALLCRAAASLSSIPRPFVRWAGSKQRLLTQIVPALPTSFGGYYEPFLGSGALFFLLQPARACLGDSCGELIATYVAVRDNPGAVLRYLRPLDVMNRDQYYAVRADRSSGRFRRAAEFLYLNRAGWNGLYRVNASGRFNVPYGAPKSATLIDEANLLECAAHLQRPGVSLATADYADSTHAVEAGDLVFFDPPYVTRHNNNGFVDYNERLFSWEDQVRLASLAKNLIDRGASVVVTNAFHAEVIALYPDFECLPLVRHSTLAGRSASRAPVREALFVHHGRARLVDGPLR